MRSGLHDLYLYEVAAGVVEHGGGDRPHLLGLLCEYHSELFEAFVLPVYVLDGE